MLPCASDTLTHPIQSATLFRGLWLYIVGSCSSCLQEKCKQSYSVGYLWFLLALVGWLVSSKSSKFRATKVHACSTIQKSRCRCSMKEVRTANLERARSWCRRYQVHSEPAEGKTRRAKIATKRNAPNIYICIHNNNNIYLRSPETWGWAVRTILRDINLWSMAQKKKNVFRVMPHRC